MSILALVDSDGLIVNSVIVDDGAEWVPDDGLLATKIDGGFEIGGHYLDGVYTPQPIIPLPPFVPQSISDRQFFQRLAIIGTISQSDALAAVKTGTIPPPLQAFINTLPTEQQFNAEMLVSGSTVFNRDHPLTAAIGAAQGMNSDQIDDFFRAAAAL